MTHNAPKYVEETIVSLNEVTAPGDREQCEVVVLDNASDAQTKELLTSLAARGYIDKLEFSPVNTFFARGNNLAADLSAPSARYLLLLNSDIRIKSPDWLSELIRLKEEGGHAAAAYGCCMNPNRADGYCLLVDRELYMKYRMDEDFPWWGSATKLQYDILQLGRSILAIDNHDDIIYHYGGKSGQDYKQSGRLNPEFGKIIASFDTVKGAVFIVNEADSCSPLKSLRNKIKKIMIRLKNIRYTIII